MGADSSTHLPLTDMPIGTTSYLSLSIAAKTLAAVEQETACSAERPPKTTATRGLEDAFIARSLSALHRLSAPQWGSVSG